MAKISTVNNKTFIDGDKVTKIAKKGDVVIYSDSRQNDCFYIVNGAKVIFKITADCSQNWAFMNVEKMSNE